MNILLINHYAGSPKLGMEYRPYYMGKYWRKMGHNITIIAATYSHVRSIQPIVSGKFEEEDMGGIRYIWLRAPSYSGNGMGRTVNMLIFIFRLFYYSNRIISKVRPDSVIASSTYPLDIFPAYWLSKRSKARLIYEVHDLWPLSPIELGGYSKWNPLIIVMQAAENFAYKHSAQVVSMLPLTLNHMMEHGLVPDKFNYVPNGFEIEEWNACVPLPDYHNSIIENLKSENKKIVCYAGSIGLANSLDCLIDAAKLLDDENISFMIVGKGPERDKICEKLRMLSLKNVYVLDPVRKEMIPQLLSKMDILYLGLKKQPLFRFGISPNKLIDYMMAGKPIVQSIETGNDLVSESGCGITVEPESPYSIASAIKKISSLSESDATKMGENGKKYVIENHNYEHLAKKFIEILKN